MMKRIIALLLALILTVGLLPTVALAAEGDAGAATAPADVIDGYYDDNNEWTKGKLPQSTVPGVQAVSKTAKPTANPNEYEVTLKVVLKQTSETKTGAAATALVLDCSGSMDWCTECGQDWCRHKTDDTYNVTFDVHNSNSYYVIENGKYVRVSYCDGYHFLSSCDGGAGWYTSDWKRDHKSQNKLTPKISQTDSAATHVQFYTRTEGSFDTSRMTAAKNAAKNFLKTYSGFDASVIKDDGSLKDTAKDLSIKRYVAVIRFSNNIDNDTDSSSWWEGEDYKPAWYDVSTVVGYNKVLATINNASAGGGTNLDAGLTTASSLMDADLVKNLTSKNVIALTDGAPTYSKSYGDGGSTNQDICNETAKTAETLRVKSKVYTVCFAAESESLYDGGGTVGNFLKERIATQPAEGSNEKYAYNAKSAEDLIKVFKDITDTIVSGLNNGTVKDSLPTGITSTDFGNATQFELNDQKQFHKDVKTETVDGKEVTTYTYTKTYTVKIDPKTVKTENVDGVDYAPLNGETTLTVKNGDQNATIHFPIPAGKVTMPSYTVTFKDGANEAVFKDETQQVEYGKPIPSHADPVRPGYNFTGWTSEPANYQPGTGTMPANNITFTAQWTEKTSVTISYVAKEGGSVNKVSESLNPDTGEATGSTATASTGYTFDGWYSDSECTEAKKVGGQATFIPTKPTTGWVDGTTFYAKFTKNTYTVTYTDGVDGAEVFADDEHNNVAYGDTIPVFTNGTPTREGYNFIGWTSSVEGVTPSSAMPASNVTFTAQWKEKDKVTINYVAKTGGSVTLANETLNPDTGTAAGSTATPNADYAFAGWYSDPECTEAKKVGSNVDFTPTKPEGGWVTTTYYAKFEQIQVNVNLSPYVKKTLEVDGTLPTGFSETFKVDVTVDGQRLQQQGTVTMTADGTSNFSMPTVTLTCGVHTIVVQEVVAPQTKNSNIAYGTNPESFVLNVTASGVQYGSTDSEENFVVVTGSPFVTITNKYTQPTETFDLNTLITKEFKKDPTREGKDIPTGTYIFTAQIFEADDTWQQVGERPVYTGTATLNGAASGAVFDFDSSRNPTLASGTHRYLVKEEHGGETIDGITYDSTVYRLTITVSEDGTQPNVQIEAEPQASVLSVQSVEFASKITFTNTYFEEKDPNKCTIDFSKFVKKELTATGSKTVDEATFIVDVVGSYDGEAIANALTPTEAQATTDEDVLNTTLTATIKNVVGGSVYEEPFTGSVTVSKPGHYTFTLTERKGTQSGVTYDEAHYQVFVNIMRVGDNLVIHDATTYLNNEQVELIKLVNDVPVTAGYIVFKNTIDTGKDDYYPIIIPTIINKDTGMLNKTDHFAYVIGYPDGTVHPNGQITRAEVATIFFRLLRDEVRDGAFTTSNTYSDVAYGKWYNNPISTMSALGIITGYPDGTFKPNKPITRAEFAAIAARFDETQSGKSATFSDVIGHWAAKEIGIAYYNDWIKGYPDGTFKPDQNITRAEAMTLINRVLERKPESPADLLTNMNKWTDNMDTSKWYYLDVQEATNSHGYTRKTFNYELWRQMLPDPDWSRYER